MSSVPQEPISEVVLPVAEPSATLGRAHAAWQWIEERLVVMGDRLNPILVKEMRQAIKSRQFTLTFVLVLAAAWVVTLGGVALIGVSIFYSSSGPDMFRVYYWVLCFPLAIIVPYSAYRSLAAEKEDNTYELLAVSTLTPRQIIAGKLASAFTQMMVYLSAVAPCLAFTYLLRGIDVLTIALLITYAVLGSLGLCAIGLLIATSAKQRYGQVVMSVALVVGLVIAFFSAVGIASQFVDYSYSLLDEPGFWMANMAVLTAFLTTFALVFLAAAAQITFTSDNRSTPLRIAMLVQHVAFVSWVGYAYTLFAQQTRQTGFGGLAVGQMVVITATVCGIYWFIMGSMMIAEWPVLSRRVQRSLPKSFLARVLLTWFNPGPGTGFVFAVANLASIVVIGLLAVGWGSSLFAISTFQFMSVQGVTYFLIIGLSYVTLFLGIGKLLVDLLRRVAVVPVAGAILLQAFLLAAGCFVPMMFQLMSPSMRNTGYSLLQASNPFWSLIELIAGRSPSAEADVLIFLIPALAIAVFFLNFSGIAREIRQRRIALPARVAEEEAILHPPEEPRPQSPWDDDELENDEIRMSEE